MFSDTVQEFQDIMKYYQSNGCIVSFEHNNNIVVRSINDITRSGVYKIIYSGQSLRNALSLIDLDMSVKTGEN